MKIRVRTDIETDPVFDVRFIEDMLGGEYDDIYIILSTLDSDPAEAWVDQGESFLLINLPKERVVNATINYKEMIIKSLPMLSWLNVDELEAYIHERWKNNEE